MSIHLHLQNESLKNPDSAEALSDSSSDSDDDQTFDDWNDSLFSGDAKIQSLFDETTVGSVEEVLQYDKEKYGVDLDEIWEGLKGKASGGSGLDFLGRVRLVNWIRKTKPKPDAVKTLTGSEDLFRSEEYLVPVIEDDPLLQYAPPNDAWSDESDAEADAPSSSTVPNTTVASSRIQSLEKKLVQVKNDFEEYRVMVRDRMNLKEVFDEAKELESSGIGKLKEKAERDDDSHYFESYGYNDIHATMIRDSIRTSSYARFILSNPALFEGKTVLDVGCGTGILSLFAARSGAKSVYAVEASPVGKKAEEIMRLNGMDEVVKVVRGKVEDVVLPKAEGDEEVKVDIIISEWMGYALLYESMLDSVLVARDRFLKPGGVMAPSQCHMMLGLCDASEVKKDRIDWWGDVYGFDMSPMTPEIYNEAVIDVVGPQTLLSEPFCVQDLYISEIPTPTASPSSTSSKSTHSPLNRFSSQFTLKATTSRKQTVSAFVLYFDTFFTSDGSRISADEPDGKVRIVREEDAVEAEVWPLGAGSDSAKRRRGSTKVKRRKSSGSAMAHSTASTGEEDAKGNLTAEPESVEEEIPKRTVTSFSTGPQSIPTHWKQTLFLLREGFVVHEDTVVYGTFICRKSEDNSRELEVEIHYSVKPSPDDVGSAEDGDDAQDVIVQIYKVR